ncbi:endonuclease/exonuclease/phosphatase (EEP) superfamily protein YafD [Algoriphagus sp. 4150]|uniref:endonuclease/exonuclease/phosphatase family protein n=1 Tax=Algoriphagus sp. 4150 TaxID=2817756 RepID=UPI00286147AE|nr:endonuclease/exonuclease/phosphatase family protein [Algoriphagus sp. 4150]MDR7132233.1 endonuclease/exonuclease/phosphatase (EEP) superfamily protein YafD [Algoriphagus sp. 4150]
MVYILLRLFSAFFLFATFFPVVKLDYWWVRVFDYPRLQKLVILIALICCWLFDVSIEANLESYLWVSALAIASIYLITKVWPFTPLGKKMIDTVPYSDEEGIHILVGNVYQYNDKYGKAVALAKAINPDLIFFVETDKAWEKGLSEIEKQYPTQIKIPLDNTYGLLLYSRMEIVRQEVNYLVDDEIPSLEIDVKLRNGEIITIYAIHPTPPVPGENTESTERDAEILIVGKKAKNNPKPSLVIGDLNDVAWSYTTELFLKNSEMADPRRGRGLFNTFHAKVPLFRWPLDHIFLSKHFGLAALKVEKDIGSDHFPISLKAVLTKSDTTETMRANGEEKKEAHEKINRGLSGIE